MYASLLSSVYFLYHDMCVLISICYLSHSFTGGTSKKPRASHPRYVRKTGEGQFMDEDERRRKIVDKVTSKRKGKEQRVNYKTMNLVDYATLRQRNWYDQQKEEDIEERSFLVHGTEIHIQ